MNFEQLIQAFEQVHNYLQEKAVSAVNQSLTIRNWLFGHYIVEYEQNGEDRAKYGTELLKSIADRLRSKNIIWQISSAKSDKEVRHTRYKGVEASVLLYRLSFSHIIEIAREEDDLKRAFYELQAIKGNWSVAELQRQMGSLLYERTGLSANKKAWQK